MIKSFSVAAGKVLAKNADYAEDKEEILVYMVTRLVANIICLTILFIFASVLDIRLTALVMLITFLPIRRTFGGWHVENIYLCIMISIVVPLAAGYLATKTAFNAVFLTVVYSLAYGIALRVGVVDNKNKRLKESRKAKFKKQGLISLTIIALINGWAMLDGHIQVSNAMIFAVAIGFLNLLFAKK